MQLRSFSNYNNVAPIVPTLTGVSGQTTNFSCCLVNLDGTSAGAGYLQIFDLAAVGSLVSGTTVPLKSISVLGAGPLPSITNALGTIALTNGLCIAMSSTEFVYTAVATVFDVFGEVAEFETDNTLGTTVVGDLTTNRQSLTAWANGGSTTGLFSIRKIIAKNNSGGPAWLFIATNSLIAPKVAFIAQPVFASGETRVISFGDSGLVPFNADGDVKYDGCYLVFSSTGTAITVVGATNYFKVFYV